jgi:hypothetical protein
MACKPSSRANLSLLYFSWIQWAASITGDEVRAPQCHFLLLKEQASEIKIS